MEDFEWDENKRKNNLEKHGIDFIDALEVFSDPHYIEYESIRNAEIRYQVIGKIVDVIVILVVYTSRHKKKRMISARRASKKEREAYFNF
jgi:uncharacterized DUF497 family protein